MGEIKLKPCPFCGRKANFVIDAEYREKYEKNGNWIKCSSCGVETPYFDTAEEAAAAWNKRAGQDGDAHAQEL